MIAALMPCAQPYCFDVLPNEAVLSCFVQAFYSVIQRASVRPKHVHGAILIST